MPQDCVQDNRSLAVTSHSAVLADIEDTLSFDPRAGTFSFGSAQGVDVTSTIEITVTNTVPQRIAINAGKDIKFEPFTPSSKPFSCLPFNNSGAFAVVSCSENRIEIDVTHLPSANGVLGFVLFVQLNRDGFQAIPNIETPPFLIKSTQASSGRHVQLKYERATGEFTLTENDAHVTGSISLEKGLVILRTGEENPAPPPSPEIIVSLDQDGVVFAHPAAKFNPDAGVSVHRRDDKNIVITRTFIPGTCFCMSLGVHLTDQNCTIYSPDPIIIDKQIGTGGG